MKKKDSGLGRVSAGTGEIAIFTMTYQKILNFAKKVTADHVVVYQKHQSAHGSYPSFRHPKSFSEKIAYRKIYPQKIYSALSDKFFVREFVRMNIGDEYLPRLYAVTNNIEKFDFSKLPNSFVMKATHGSGWTEIVYDRNNTNIDSLRKMASSWLAQDYSRVGRERHYSSIPAQIIFEELLTRSGIAVDDYKVHCFRSGERLIQLIQVHTHRFTNHKINIFSDNWDAVDVDHGYPRSDPEFIKKPENLSTMLRISDLLSKQFNYVRVDLYNANERIIFGELTFTPGSGLDTFNPPESDMLWGSFFEPDATYFRAT